MPAFPSLLRLKHLLLSTAMLIAEDKPESNQPRTEPRAQQPTIQTTTRNWANIPTFPTAGQTESLPLRQKHKLAKNSRGERKSTTDKSTTSLRKNSAATSKQLRSAGTILSNHPLRLLPFHYARLQRPQNQRRLEKNPVKNGKPRNAQTAYLLARTSNSIPNNRPRRPNRHPPPKLRPMGRSPKH